jgi:hypothetical protein
MKRFLIKFVLFLLPIVLLAYGADYFISSNLRKSNEFVKGEFTVWNDLYNNNVNSKILIMGSSRAWVHIDAKMLGDSLHTSAYNLGIDGHNFWMQNYRRILAMKQQVQPKVIIQSIDVFTLEKRVDLFYSEQFLPYMLGNDELEHVTESFVGFTHPDFHIPMFRYYGKGPAVIESLKMAFGANNPSTRIRGFQGQEQGWNNDLDIAKARMGSYTVKLDPGTVKIFEDYLKECQKKNIQVVFVYCPEYIEGQNFIANRKEMMAVYSKWSQQYNIPFFDYSNDPISFNKKYFYNALHMNKPGAEYFTYKFVQDLKKLPVSFN